MDPVVVLLGFLVGVYVYVVSATLMHSDDKLDFWVGAAGVIVAIFSIGVIAFYSESPLSVALAVLFGILLTHAGARGYYDN